MRKSRELLAKERTMVLAIAHAMESHKTITGDDVHAVLEGRQGPLVDGRWYHTEEFSRVIEQYHSKAVEAHRLHGHVEVPLPEPSQPVGVIALPVAAAMVASGTTNGASHAPTLPVAHSEGNPSKEGSPPTP
jgi:cell division protease FtsH